MADPVKTVPSKETLVKHLNQVEEECLKLVGNVNINPHLYVKRNVTPVRAELLAAKEVTAALAEKALAVKVCKAPEVAVKK